MELGNNELVEVAAVEVHGFGGHLSGEGHRAGGLVHDNVLQGLIIKVHGLVGTA